MLTTQLRAVISREHLMQVVLAMSEASFTLSGEQPIARGVEHLVFDHPERADRLLKLPTDNWSPDGVIERVLLPLRKASRARSLRREVRYWSDLMSRISSLPPVPCYEGTAATDLGIAHVVERITLPDRPLGPTLRQVSNRGALGPRRIELLNNLISSIREFEIPARDVVPRNIVLGDRGRGPEFVLVDGFGDDGILPLRKMSATIRERSLDASCALMAEQLKLAWDPAARLFSRD